MEQYPEYLYHYTSIETLALILKYKTFRLRRLDLADDPEESLTSDYGNLGRFCLISCWTSMAEESLPMWQMYSKNMKGVRIKLPTFIFPKYYMEETKCKNSPQNGYKKELLGNTFYSYINPEDFFNRGCSVINMQENILTKIQYTEDKEMLYPTVHKEADGKITLEIKKIGKYKHKYWEFQQELRYLIFASPWNNTELLNATPQSHLKLFDRLKYSDLSFEYIDLKVDEKKFQDMTIKLAPKVTEAERIIVQSLVKEFNPLARIEESVLKVR